MSTDDPRSQQGRDDRPQSWEELRRQPLREATDEVPEHLAALDPQPLPPKEVRFLDRVAPDGATVEPAEGFLPPWVASRVAPRRARRAMDPVVTHRGRRLDPLTIWWPDDRRTYDDQSYPWGCVCRITNAEGRLGSGVLVGPRHVLTASHVVAWNTSDSELVEVHRAGATAAATAWDTAAYAYTRISGDPTFSTVDEDYAVLVTQERLGDRFGWLGVKTYDSDWDDDAVFSSIGYASDVAGTVEPVYQLNKSLDEDEWDLGGGRAMTTTLDVKKMQSGSAVFSYWGGSPYAVAVISAEGELFLSGNENWCSGGNDLTRLVKQARAENP